MHAIVAWIRVLFSKIVKHFAFYRVFSSICAFFFVLLCSFLKKRREVVGALKREAVTSLQIMQQGQVQTRQYNQTGQTAT